VERQEMRLLWCSCCLGFPEKKVIEN
jgi:hypothetical protein